MRKREGRSLQSCRPVLLLVYIWGTIHTCVFCFVMFTVTISANTAPCNSVEDCFKPEIVRHNYTGVGRFVGGQSVKYQGSCLLGIPGGDVWCVQLDCWPVSTVSEIQNL